MTRLRALASDAASLAWALGVLLGGVLPAFVLAGLSELGVDVPRMMGWEERG